MELVKAYEAGNLKSPNIPLKGPAGNDSNALKTAALKTLDAEAQQATDFGGDALNVATGGTTGGPGVIDRSSDWFDTQVEGLKDWAFGSDTKSSETGPVATNKYSELSDTELKAIDYKTLEGEELKQLRQEVAKRYVKRFK